VPDIDDLPCQELVELVTEYLENRLPDPTRLRFDAHLAQCSGCRTYLEQMRQTIQALGRLPDESIEPEARDQLLEVFRDWKRNPNV
jgi:anti-sigma factor RsiW